MESLDEHDAVMRRLRFRRYRRAKAGRARHRREIREIAMSDVQIAIIGAGRRTEGSARATRLRVLAFRRAHGARAPR